MKQVRRNGMSSLRGGKFGEQVCSPAGGRACVNPRTVGTTSAGSPVAADTTRVARTWPSRCGYVLAAVQIMWTCDVGTRGEGPADDLGDGLSQEGRSFNAQMTLFRRPPEDALADRVHLAHGMTYR